MVLPGGAVNKRPSRSPHLEACSNPIRGCTPNSGNNTPEPGSPSSAVAVHHDRRTRGRSAVITVGGSYRNSHEDSHLLFTDIATLLKHSDA